MSFAFNIPFAVEKAPSWVNPYITDGLIAMWDGEWNAGGGKHDANATVWKDLSGTLDLFVITTPLWGDNFCTFESPGNGWISAENIDPYIPNILSGREGTVEVVTQAIPGTSTNKIITGSKINQLTFRQQGADATRIGFSFQCGGQIVGLGYGGGNPVRSSATAKMSDGIWTLVRHFGGVDRTDSRGSVTYPISNDQKVAVGVRIDNTNDGYFIGDIFCVRYYDRCLSDQEMASNYAVDKARFNLS